MSLIVTVQTPMGDAYFIADDHAPRMTEAEAHAKIVPGKWISVHPDDLVEWLPEDFDWPSRPTEWN